jgi:hypothetical protein
MNDNEGDTTTNENLTAEEKEQKQIKAILRKEYPDLLKQDIDRLAKTCVGEKWFEELRRERLSEDLKTGKGKVVVAANSGGEAKDDRPAVCEEQYGAAEQYDEEAESKKPERDLHVKALEWAAELFLSTKSDRVRHMRCSLALGFLKGNLNIHETAEHFKVTPERAKQVLKDVKHPRSDS